jgi:hypothetical protein
VTELGYDSRDSEWEPYRGQKFSLQGYFPAKSIASSVTFQKLLLQGEMYWILDLKTQFKISGAISSVSQNAPYWWYSQLSGTVPFSGVKPTRFIDRSLAALGTELRWKQLSPVTWLAYAEMGKMGPSLTEMFSNLPKWGAGVGAEVHLTRFRNRAVRLELGNFGGEWGFNSTFGLPLD